MSPTQIRIKPKTPSHPPYSHWCHSTAAAATLPAAPAWTGRHFPRPAGSPASDSRPPRSPCPPPPPPGYSSWTWPPSACAGCCSWGAAWPRCSRSRPRPSGGPDARWSGPGGCGRGAWGWGRPGAGGRRCLGLVAPCCCLCCCCWCLWWLWWWCCLWGSWEAGWTAKGPAEMPLEKTEKGNRLVNLDVCTWHFF